MKPAREKPGIRCGALLLEAVIAIGVLAVTIPLVFEVLGEAAKSCGAARAETSSCWIVPACIAEVSASREGCPQWLPVSTCGQVFPPSGEVWALAFSRSGDPLGCLSKAHYEQGVRVVAGQSVRFIAALEASPAAATPGLSEPLVRVHVAIEYPAVWPAARREKIDYYTYLP